MSRSNVGKVNVGALINPTEGLSRSLSDLSAMYGRQADSKDRKDKLNADRLRNDQRYTTEQTRLAAAAKESKSRFDVQEGRRAVTFNQNQEKLASGKKFSNLVASGQLNNHKFSLDTMAKGVAQKIKDERAVLNKEKEELLGNLLNDTSNYSAFTRNLDVTPHHKDTRDRILGNRKSSVLQIQQELGMLKGNARVAKANEYADSLYKDRLGEINRNILTGKYLTKGEKADSIIRSLDPKMVGNLNSDYVRKSILGNLNGMTIDEIRAGESARVKSLDADTKFNINTKVKLGKLHKGKGGSYSTKDLANYNKYMEDLDIGWTDNADARTAASKLFMAGQHPMAIIQAIDANINRGADDTFFNPETDTEAFKALSEQTDSITTKLQGKGGIPRLDMSAQALTFRSSAPRSVDDIRKMRMSYESRIGRLTDFVPKNKNTAYMVDSNGVGPTAFKILPKTSKKPMSGDSINTRKELFEKFVPNVDNTPKISAYGNILPDDFKLNAAQQSGIDVANAIARGSALTPTPANLIKVSLPIIKRLQNYMSSSTNEFAKRTKELQNTVRSNKENYRL